MATKTVQHGNRNYIVRRNDQVCHLLDEHCRMSHVLEKGLDVVTAAEMVEYLKGKIEEVSQLL